MITNITDNRGDMVKSGKSLPGINLLGFFERNGRKVQQMMPRKNPDKKTGSYRLFKTGIFI